MSIEQSTPSSEGDPHRLPPARARIRKTPPVSGQSADDHPADGKDYTVGYKKPPKHTQFQKGRSGNPKGRPKQAKGIKTIARETLTAKVEVRTASGVRKITRMEAVMHKTVELAMKGNPRALAQLITLYGAAVPDPVTAPDFEASEADFSETDLAMLDALRASIGQQAEAAAPDGPLPKADLQYGSGSEAPSAAEIGPPTCGIANGTDQSEAASGPPPAADPVGSDWDREVG